jgi:hypothetical protein
MNAPDISKWEHRGKTYLWKYRDNARNFPGWHFTADNESCAAFDELFETINKARNPGVYTIPLCAPTQKVLSVPNNQGGRARFEPAKKLKIKYSPSQPDEWNMTFKNSTVTLNIGRNYLQALQKGIKDIKAGNGDYAIGPMEDENRIWVWWMV